MPQFCCFHIMITAIAPQVKNSMIKLSPGTWGDLTVISTWTKTYTDPIFGNPESVFRSCDHFPGYHMWYASFSTEIVRGAMPYNLFSLSIPTWSLTSKLRLQCTGCAPSPPLKNSQYNYQTKRGQVGSERKVGNRQCWVFSGKSLSFWNFIIHLTEMVMVPEPASSTSSSLVSPINDYKILYK